jgi:hypothetical protein
MKTLCLFLLTLLCGCTVAFGEVIPFDTKIDFDQQVVESDGVWLVRFCSSSCTSADDDVLAKLSDLVKGIWSVATVSSTNEIADSYKIQKSPTYYIFSADKSKPLQYKGKTDPESLVQVMMDETIQMFQTRIGGRPSGTNGSSGGSSGGGSSNGKKKGASVVVEATEANYEEVVLNNPHVVLVAFTAPWVSHSVRFIMHHAYSINKINNNSHLLSTFIVRILQKIRTGMVQCRSTVGRRRCHTGQCRCHNE